MSIFIYYIIYILSFIHIIENYKILFTLLRYLYMYHIRIFMYFICTYVGEGEHKIMQHIRNARAKHDYQPNQRHCMYGQDADLIMLALATHEPHFTLLREVIDFNSFKGRSNSKSTRQTIMKQSKEAEFQLLHISLLREYLHIEFSYGLKVIEEEIVSQQNNIQKETILEDNNNDTNIEIIDENDHIHEDTVGVKVRRSTTQEISLDRERLIDDFIFLTFLVGNDFLPHLPTLDIGEEAFEVIFNAYKTLILHTTSTITDTNTNNNSNNSNTTKEKKKFEYLVKDGEIRDMLLLEQLFAIIGEQEEEILYLRDQDIREFTSRRKKGNDMNALSIEELEAAEEALQNAYEEAIMQQMILEASKGSEVTSSSSATMLVPDDHPPTIIEGVDEDGFPVIIPSPSISLENTALPTVSSENISLPIEVKRVRPSRLQRQKEAIESAAAERKLKDYHGRYYYEKFKILPCGAGSVTFLRRLMKSYLEGLLWCLAYYVKGCISWTWFFPYHYGPMLRDMKNLNELLLSIEFHIGQPFQPFQQLLGCLPPFSKSLLPKTYQWLMTSDRSPIKEFYPEEFQIDMNGKRSPWEAVVLLPFIDENKLIHAERQFCLPSLLTPEEKARNTFGSLLHVQYDPTAQHTVYSCNPAIGLPDIPSCVSSVWEEAPEILPGVPFQSVCMPGTKLPCPGYPSLTVLPVNAVRWDAIKINVFGSESKYTSMILEMNPSKIKLSEFLEKKLNVALGRSVYVNYPSMHESKIVAITTSKGEARLLEDKTVINTLYEEEESERWNKESENDINKYLKGRSLPGTGGIDIGTVEIRLRVLPLQGMIRDPKTGATIKKFGTIEADIPVSMALLNPPAEDPRFVERDGLPVEERFPLGCVVLILRGDYRGRIGKVVGPHNSSRVETNKRMLNSLKNHSKGDTSSQRRSINTLIVEFPTLPDDVPFGYTIAASIQDRYYSSREVCQALEISPNVFGKIVGAIFVDPGRYDVGLNLKKNGQYHLLGYARKVVKDVFSNDTSTSSSSKKENVWNRKDTVKIIGSTAGNNNDIHNVDGEGGNYFEYSVKAISIIAEYKCRFPMLFSMLTQLPHKPRYSALELFGKDGEKVLEDVNSWLTNHPISLLPRTPFSTLSLPRYDRT